MLSSRIDWSSGNCNWYELFCLFFLLNKYSEMSLAFAFIVYSKSIFFFSKFIPQCCTNINDEDDILSHLTISLKATVLHYSSIRYTLFTLSGYIASSYLVLQYLYLSSWQFPLCTNVLHILHLYRLSLYIRSITISNESQERIPLVLRVCVIVIEV